MLARVHGTEKKAEAELVPQLTQEVQCVVTGDVNHMVVELTELEAVFVHPPAAQCVEKAHPVEALQGHLAASLAHSRADPGSAQHLSP